MMNSNARNSPYLSIITNDNGNLVVVIVVACVLVRVRVSIIIVINIIIRCSPYSNPLTLTLLTQLPLLSLLPVSFFTLSVLGFAY